MDIIWQEIRELFQLKNNLIPKHENEATAICKHCHCLILRYFSENSDLSGCYHIQSIVFYEYLTS